jgi:AraC-like DNA-binding protein
VAGLPRSRPNLGTGARSRRTYLTVAARDVNSVPVTMSCLTGYRLPDVADLADAWRPACARRLETALAAAATPAQCRIILTGAIAGRLADSPGPHPGVLAAVSLLGMPTATAAGAACCASLSARQLRRLFDDHVGLPPKTLQTILRFQRFRAWLAIPRRMRSPLAQAATECGYFDHAHLCRDCIRLAGVTPSTLLAAAPSPALGDKATASASG